nr:T-complex protein 1 subunit beta [Tanacetum cinerariifolium]
MKLPKRRVNMKKILGPKGMDKILQWRTQCQSDECRCYNLKSLHIDNPTAKVFIDISKIQDDVVGDGTTSVVVLAGELLREDENDNNFRLQIITLQDKILQSTGRGHSVTVTNDGATILKSLHIDNPAAKVLIGKHELGVNPDHQESRRVTKGYFLG